MGYIKEELAFYVDGQAIGKIEEAQLIYDADELNIDGTDHRKEFIAQRGFQVDFKIEPSKELEEWTCNISKLVRMESKRIAKRINKRLKHLKRVKNRQKLYEKRKSLGRA